MNRREQVRRFRAVERYRRIAGLTPPEPSRMATSFTEFTKTAGGQDFLDWLYLQTHGKIMPQDASDSALREHDGARRLCDQILRLVEEPHVGTGTGTRASRR